MFGIGPGELVLVLFLALLVLGPERMPKMARDLGRVMGELRKTSDDLRDEFLNADAAIRETIDVSQSSDHVKTPTSSPVQEPSALVAGESAFDRELREARERLKAKGTPSTTPTD